MKKTILYVGLITLVAVGISIPSGASVLTTKHNLSVSGPGAIKSTTEERVCVFCHIPHGASTEVSFLWNRALSVESYTPYTSSTLFATVGQPTGASKLCLSCHDGTIALGALISEPVEIPFEGGIRFIPEGPTKLGTDLSDDHPVSFVYDNTLAVEDGELADPAGLSGPVRLEGGGELQCTSCHDPHEDSYGKFLVVDNIRSGLCTTCHEKTGWTASSHATSVATWNGTGTDPWPDTSWTKVEDNACISCHKPHTAPKPERLLRYPIDEDNCLVCHTGNVASKNIGGELTKFYGHKVQNFNGIHDAAEDYTLSVANHIECQDCHNPHQASGSASPGAPSVSGPIRGVSGISAIGQGIVNSLNQYEICFKCHGDITNNVVTTFPTTRQIDQLDTLKEFDPANPSFHPVEQRGVNNNVPSLLSPYTPQSIIFCTDCHGNNDAAGPAGPHGSTNKHILVANYTTTDFTKESSFEYALCYKCHSRTSILNDDSFKEHKKHIDGEDAPCNACHDPHGISHTQATMSNGMPNNTHLINFDISIVQPYNGQRMFEDWSDPSHTFSGRCFLRCHGEDHKPEAYGGAPNN
jgi:predicted CXXCH cytochrome family protein